MVSLMSLWLPILLSAVFVFIVSSIIHMMLPYHKSDFKKLPKEDEVMDALRGFNIPEGDYFMPNACEKGGMKNKEIQDKFAKGPVAMMTVMKSGSPNMASSLILWFFYSIVVSILAAYVTTIALPPNAHYMVVFRYISSTAFIGYSIALLQNSIWYNRNWGATIKSMFDGLIYALLTAGTFGWLWPKM